MNFKKNTPKLGEDEAQVGTIPRHKYIFSLRRLAVFLGVAILVPAVFGTAHVFLGQPEVSETEEQLEVSPYIEVDGQLLEFPEHLRYMGNHQEQQVDPEVLQEALEDHKATKNEQDEYGYYVFLAQIYSRMDDKNKQLEAYKGALAVVERQPIISHEQEQIHQGLLREIAELEVELNDRKAKIGLGLSFGLAVVSVFTIGLLKISAMHGENGDATVGCNYVQRAVRATPGQDIYRTVSVIAYHDYNTDWPGMEAIDSWLKGWEITANCMLDESNLLSYNNIRADRVWFGFGADDGSGFLPTGQTGSGYPCALGAAPDYPGVDYCAGLGRRYSVKQDDGAYIALPDAGRILHCRGYGDIYPGCGQSVYDRGVGTGVGGNCGACNPAYPVSSNAYLGSGFATYPLEDMTSYFGLNAQGRLQDTPISFKVRNTWQGGYRAEAVFTLRYPNTPPQLSCGALTTNPQNPGVGQSFSLRARFSNGSSGEVSNATHPMTITIPPGITPTGSANVNYSPSPLTSSSSGGGVAESVRSGLVATTTGRYTVNWSVSGSNASISCSGEVEIADSPYFRVYGGDVFVGSGFRDQTNTCTPNPDAAILARNRGSATYGGSATQIAAYALRPIEGFATASLRGSPPTRPIGLTFANQPATGYGGNWSSDNVRHCIPDYFAQHTNLAAYQTGATDGAYHSVGNTTLGGRTLNTGDKLSIYVSGDVHITGNITYNQTGSPSAINDIPYFQLVAQGNIYIHPSVTQIDGVLIAQPDPDNANTGTLYTCSNGFTPANRSLVSGSCNDNSLAIYGAVVARQLKFLRSTGSLHTAASNEPHTSANIAERIIFTPEVWLSNPAITQPPREPYEAFTTLPPVL